MLQPPPARYARTVKNPRPQSGAGYGHHTPSEPGSDGGLYDHDGQYVVLIDNLAEDGRQSTTGVSWVATPEVYGIFPTQQEAIGQAHEIVAHPRGLPDWFAWVEQDGRFVYGIYTFDTGHPPYIETRDLDYFKRGLADMGYTSSLNVAVTPNPRPVPGVAYGRHQESAAELRPIVVGFDEGPVHHASAWNAYTDGKTWNGFIVPWVDAETRDDIIDFLEYVDEEEESDASDTVALIRALEPHLKDTPDGKRELYQIDEGLTFHEVESPATCPHCSAIRGDTADMDDIQCLDCGKTFYRVTTNPRPPAGSSFGRRQHPSVASGPAHYVVWDDVGENASRAGSFDVAADAIAKARALFERSQHDGFFWVEEVSDEDWNHGYDQPYDHRANGRFVFGIWPELGASISGAPTRTDHETADDGVFRWAWRQYLKSEGYTDDDLQDIMRDLLRPNVKRGAKSRRRTTRRKTTRR